MTVYLEWMARLFAVGTIVVGAFVMVALLMVAGMWAFEIIYKNVPGYRLALWVVSVKRYNKTENTLFFWRAFDELARSPSEAERMVERAQKAVDKWNREHSES